MKLLPCVDAVFHLYNTSKKGKKDAVTSALLKDLSFLGVTKGTPLSAVNDAIKTHQDAFFIHQDQAFTDLYTRVMNWSEDNKDFPALKLAVKEASLKKAPDENQAVPSGAKRPRFEEPVVQERFEEELEPSVKELIQRGEEYSVIHLPDLGLTDLDPWHLSSLYLTVSQVSKYMTEDKPLHPIIKGQAHTFMAEKTEQMNKFCTSFRLSSAHSPCCDCMWIKTMKKIMDDPAYEDFYTEQYFVLRSWWESVMVAVRDTLMALPPPPLKINSTERPEAGPEANNTRPEANNTRPEAGPEANNTGPEANNTRPEAGPEANNTGPEANNTGPEEALTGQEQTSQLIAGV